MQESDDEMTPAQREAVEKAWTLITEHFERILLVVDFDVESEDRYSATEAFWYGGWSSSLGLSEAAKQMIANKRFKREP